MYSQTKQITSLERLWHGIANCSAVQFISLTQFFMSLRDHGLAENVSRWRTLPANLPSPPALGRRTRNHSILSSLCVIVSLAHAQGSWWLAAAAGAGFAHLRFFFSRRMGRHSHPSHFFWPLIYFIVKIYTLLLIVPLIPPNPHTEANQKDAKQGASRRRGGHLNGWLTPSFKSACPAPCSPTPHMPSPFLVTFSQPPY
jgi:hypothetical protein